MIGKRQISEHTFRFADIGLVTRATPKFKYMRVTLNGKVHIVSAVFFRWDVYPHPKVTIATECGGRQYSRLLIPAGNEFPADECCIKCFKLNSRTAIRSHERREAIVEAIESFDYEFTIRDVWMKAPGHYGLVCLVMAELRERGLVAEVSNEHTLPKRFMRIDRLTMHRH